MRLCTKNRNTHKNPGINYAPDYILTNGKHWAFAIRIDQTDFMVRLYSLNNGIEGFTGAHHRITLRRLSKIISTNIDCLALNAIQLIDDGLFLRLQCFGDGRKVSL